MTRKGTYREISVLLQNNEHGVKLGGTVGALNPRCTSGSHHLTNGR